MHPLLNTGHTPTHDVSLNHNPLQYLLGDLSVENFFAQYWDQAPCLNRGTDKRFDAVLSIAAIDHMLASTELRWPYVRLYQQGKEIPAADYTHEADISGGGVETLTRPDDILKHFARGATLSLLSIESYHAPVAQLCTALQNTLNDRIERIHTNAYLTPRSAQGFDYHWDTHDVIVLQLAGVKHWQVFGSPLPLPSTRQVCGSHQALIDSHVQTQPPCLDIEMHPGDLLYLPRGAIHAARTTDHHSLHLTLGLTVRTRLRVLDQYMAAQLAHCAALQKFNQPLPLDRGMATTAHWASLIETFTRQLHAA